MSVHAAKGAKGKSACQRTRAFSRKREGCGADITAPRELRAAPRGRYHAAPRRRGDARTEQPRARVRAKRRRSIPTKQGACSQRRVLARCALRAGGAPSGCLDAASSGLHTAPIATRWVGGSAERMRRSAGQGSSNRRGSAACAAARAPAAARRVARGAQASPPTGGGAGGARVSEPECSVESMAATRRARGAARRTRSAARGRRRWASERGRHHPAQCRRSRRPIAPDPSLLSGTPESDSPARHGRAGCALTRLSRAPAAAMRRARGALAERPPALEPLQAKLHHRRRATPCPACARTAPPRP